LRNGTVEAWEKAGRPPAGRRPGEGEVVARGPNGKPVVRYEDKMPSPMFSGDVEALALYAGQSAGLTTRVQPAGRIVGDIVRQAQEALDKLGAPSAGWTVAASRSCR
jgi:nitronate monooxygenase